MKQIIVWSLFDSGNGSYNKVLKDSNHFENFSIGIDQENKNTHFLNLNLADYSRLFGKDNLIKHLDKLPKPDIIIASPPCESWSVASAIKGGNACWYQNKEQKDFKIRGHNDYIGTRYNQDKQTIKRINGELCIVNTLHIIEHYKPSIYVIENPKSSKIWEYIDKILGYKLIDNHTYYNNYGYQIKKPTNFLSNINLNLDNTNKKAEKQLEDVSTYNERSNIPEELVKKIFNECYKYLKEDQTNA